MRQILALPLAIALSGPLPALSQSQPADAFPTQPVRILVGFSPGGSNHIVARLLAPKLAERLGQQVVVENKPGAAGNIAAAQVLAAPADGHTVLMCTTGTFSIQPHLPQRMPFDSQADFAPVTQVALAPYFLLINWQLPYQSVSELIAGARSKPGSLNFGSSGNGTGAHLAGEMLKAEAGIDMVHIPYKGTGQAMADLVAGQVEMMFDQPVSSVGYIRSGKLRALAVANSRRLPAFPEIPTVKEAGLADFEPVTWTGICAPRNTPAPAIAKLQQAFADVLKMPDIAERLVRDGLEPVGSTPDEFRDFLVKDRARWGRAVEQAGMKSNPARAQ